MKPIINHFTDNDLYSFTCMYYISQKYPRAEMEYCFFDRNRTCYPKGFEQMLREQLEHLAHVVITDEDIRHHSHDGGLPSIRAFKVNDGIWPVHCVQHTHGASIYQPVFEAVKNQYPEAVVLTKGEDIAVDKYSIMANKASAKKLLVMAKHNLQDSVL